MHIVDMIFYWARIAPHRPAVIQSRMVTSFQALAGAVESIDEHIERFNLSKQEAVAVSILNPTFMLATVFALLRAGYSVAPVGVRRRPQLADADIRTIICDADEQFLPGARNIKFDMSWLPESPQASRPGRGRRPVVNPNLIFFTSGTTGLPKTVVQPAQALDARLRSPLACGAGPYQKVLLLPGLTISFGFNFTCEVLNFGKTACFTFLDRAPSLINLFGIDVVVASAAQALALAETAIGNPSSRVDSLKAIFIGGGKVAPDGIARIRGSLCRNVINDYGSTEAGTAARSPFDALNDAAGGIVPPWVEAEIVDENDRQVPAGTAGVIRLRTPQLAETLKSAAAGETRNIRDGWFYPGDVGSLDGGGALRLVGRSSDIINRGGFKVSSARIEEILQSLPEVKEAAACPVPNASGIEEIWIGVVPNGAVDIDQIKAHLRQHEDVQIAPDEVIILNELPRGELGKVQKPALRDLMRGLRKGV